MYLSVQKSITWAWSPIDCIHQNGPIIDYTLAVTSDFVPPINHTVVLGIVSETYTVTGLIPFSVYKFQVAGRNINGTGPFSQIWYIQTLSSGNS